MDAPRGSVEFEGSDELQRLRRRAYGPDADIGRDAVAQARLLELEAAQRRELTPAAHAAARGPAAVSERVPVSKPVAGPRLASTSVPQRVPAGEPVTGQHTTEPPTADYDAIDGPPDTPGWRRRRGLVILGGAIAALALIAAGAGMSQLLADGSAPAPTETATAEMPHFPAAQGRPNYEPRPDYVLALTSVGEDADKPNDPNGTLDALGISADELRRYEDFQDPDGGSLDVWSGESRFGMTCLLVAVSDQATSYGFSTEGCSLNGKDTILDLQMGSGGHERFVLAGDQVNVYMYEGTADPNASQGPGAQPGAPDEAAQGYVLALESVGADAGEPKDPHATLNRLGLSADELRQYTDFRGLSFWSGENRDGRACLLVADPRQGLKEGIGDAVCPADGSEPIVEVQLCGGCAAPEVFAGMPIGSIFRFVLKGDHVDVYVYLTAADASQG